MYFLGCYYLLLEWISVAHEAVYEDTAPTLSLWKEESWQLSGRIVFSLQHR